jgi:hypothetical protein
VILDKARHRSNSSDDVSAETSLCPQLGHLRVSAETRAAAVGAYVLPAQTFPAPAETRGAHSEAFAALARSHGAAGVE